MHTARLKGQQAVDNLQIVFNPVMHLARQEALCLQRLRQVRITPVNDIGHAVQICAKRSDFFWRPVKSAPIASEIALRKTARDTAQFAKPN